MTEDFIEDDSSLAQSKDAEQTERARSKSKKRGRFFQKIPQDFLFSPGGAVLIIIALFFEGLDLLLPGGSLTVEVIPDVIFALLLTLIAKVPLSNSLMPFLIERIPGISDVLPTWLIRLFL